MKLTLICMVASMVMLVAQAINVEEDADGESLMVKSDIEYPLAKKISQLFIKNT